jgi:spore germination protein KA
MPLWWKKHEKKMKEIQDKQNRNDQSGMAKCVPDEPLQDKLEDNLQTMKETTGKSSDIVYRFIKAGQNPEVSVAIVYTEGLVDHQTINESLIESLLNNHDWQTQISPQKAFALIERKVVSVGDVKTVNHWGDLFLSLMSGETIILIDGMRKAISLGTKGGDKRSIQEPSTQLSLRGPRDGFTESIRTNTAMVRRRIKNPNLWLDTMKIGKVTQTDVAIMYIKGIANEEIVQEVRKRLNRINIDSILESGYIEQLMEDQIFTPFPTIYHTERPDVVAANLLEGRVAIFVDGTPFVLIAPALFIQFFQAVEDYYARFDIATALRFLRVLIFFISLVAPAVYISATTFHQEMIPTLLVIAIASQREAVPFPAFVEALIMEVTFEILREAGIRLPRAVGQALSVVGAIVIGQAAIQAGIVSPAMVIIVSITAIASLATPALSIAISARLIRFLLMFLAAGFGFYGVIIGVMIMIIHLCSLRSFGVPYMAPLAPFIPSNSGDTIFRIPTWAFKERPRLISQKNIVRQGKHQRPGPPDKEGIDTNEKGDKNET